MSPKVYTCLLIIASTMVMYCCSYFTGNEEGNNIHQQSFFSSNYGDSILNIELSFDLDSLIERKSEEDEIRAYLQFSSMANNLIPLKLSARGVNRKEQCIFPPIRLNFSKEILDLNQWNDHDKYKLVTHCLGADYDDELLLREYLTYKLYEQISGISFRTLLLKVKYKLTADTIIHYAFLLENEKELAERLGLKFLDIKETELKNIHFQHYKKFVLFQYMIGNTDWNLSGGHNTRYVLDGVTNTPIVISYDFDLAGLVNASYAKPHPSIPIDNVRERYFMYRGKIDDDFEPVKEEFIQKKGEIYSTIMDFPFISHDAKKDMIDYLTEFYDILELNDWKSYVFPN